MEPDFSGYATKTGVRCTDGRTILSNAFQHCDGASVPLVWQHQHSDPTNVLGHVVLEHRDDGVYAHGFFNGTPQADTAKELVAHGDINSLSIYANQLVEKNKQVSHGQIREVSLVLAGANPEAFIENVNLAHGEISEEEAVIYLGGELEHSGMLHADDEDTEDESPNEPTVAEVYESMNEDQRALMDVMVGKAIEETRNLTAEEDEGEVEHDDSDDPDNTLSHQEDTMGNSRNVFDQSGDKGSTSTLSHSQIETIFDDANKLGSLKESILQHAQNYGIEDIDILFPDAHLVTGQPVMITRDMEWVNVVNAETHHSPFARIKSVAADLTEPEARAKGYIKGTKKTDQVFRLLKRITSPTTIYKKQKLDRDDMLDIRDFAVVTWIKTEMRMMLKEEIARAVLFGDGREQADPDKISEDHVRPVATDDPLYTVPVKLDDVETADDVIDVILASRTLYKGSGSPTLFVSDKFITNFLTAKDSIGRRLYTDEKAVATAMRVSKIVPVDADVWPDGLIGLLVNLRDYTIGADRDGQTTMFDDFDLDFNQYRYLIETRISGCLTRPHSAIAFWGTPSTGSKKVGTLEVSGLVRAILDEAEANTKQLKRDGLVGEDASFRPLVEGIVPDDSDTVVE